MNWSIIKLNNLIKNIVVKIFFKFNIFCVLMIKKFNFDCVLIILLEIKNI